MPDDFEIDSLSIFQPFADTRDALGAVLTCLKDFVPFKVWLVARLDDNDWTIVKSLDDGYGIKRGQIFDWDSTYCARMVAGDGPMFAEDARQVQAYREACINDVLSQPVGAYIGVPLLREGGEVIATLCALDPDPSPALDERTRRLVSTFARTLNTLLTINLQAEAAEREAERLRFVAERDVLTGLYNRRGWELALKEQELAAFRHVRNALVVIVDLDELKTVNDRDGHHAGDLLLKKAADTMRKQFREQDVVARVGGDEFAALVDGATSREVQKMIERLREAFDEAGVAASIGHALRSSHDSMLKTVQHADAAMYAEKRCRHSH